MMEETLVTIRVSRKMKKRMQEIGINWSQELRKAIEEKLSTKERKDAVEKLERLLVNVKPGFDVVKAIKESRRHG